MDSHEDVVRFWNSQASGFDDEPDHGLKDPHVRAAWRTLLVGALPRPPAQVVDLGCGTGSLTVLLSECGYGLTGIDSSEAMVNAARRKAKEAHAAVTIEVGDVSSPDIAPQSVDAVLARHVVWALPDPEIAIRRWLACLRPAGVMVLIEGRWCTGTGIGSDALSAIVSPMAAETNVVELRDAALWGRPIDDERYLLRAVV
jgi:ubiquinone/menaquinone biosynthesis C-methylase UbiE